MWETHACMRRGCRNRACNRSSALTPTHAYLSQADPSGGDKPYSDLDVVKQLRKMSGDAKRGSKVTTRQSDEEVKWLDWPEFLALVQELRRECAGEAGCRSPAPARAVCSPERCTWLARGVGVSTRPAPPADRQHAA